MAQDIELTIFMPEKRVLNKKVYRIVLPTDGGTLTVIKDRAPTLLGLDLGIIKILDENNEVTDEYFVADGAVDIHDNTCKILTESALNKKDLNLEKARELYNEFHNPFYEWLVKYFETKK